MPDTVKITLTSEERQRAREWAEALNDKYASKPGLLRVWNPDLDRIQHWAQGAEAELAAAKHFGLQEPQWQIYQGHGDRGVDLTTSEGQSVQVKYRSKDGGVLATNSLDVEAELKADYYVLTWPGSAEGEFQIAGWCTREEFLQRIHSRPPIKLRGLKYDMQVSEMHSPEEGLTDAF